MLFPWTWRFIYLCICLLACLFGVSCSAGLLLKFFFLSFCCLKVSLFCCKFEGSSLELTIALFEHFFATGLHWFHWEVSHYYCCQPICGMLFFSLPLVFSILILMWPGVVFFVFILLEVHWASWICKLILRSELPQLLQTSCLKTITFINSQFLEVGSLGVA